MLGKVFVCFSEISRQIWARERARARRRCKVKRFDLRGALFSVIRFKLLEYSEQNEKELARKAKKNWLRRRDEHWTFARVTALSRQALWFPSFLLHLVFCLVSFVWIVSRVRAVFFPEREPRVRLCARALRLSASAGRPRASENAIIRVNATPSL